MHRDDGPITPAVLAALGAVLREVVPPQRPVDLRKAATMLVRSYAWLRQGEPPDELSQADIIIAVNKRLKERYGAIADRTMDQHRLVANELLTDIARLADYYGMDVISRSLHKSATVYTARTKTQTFNDLVADIRSNK